MTLSLLASVMGSSVALGAFSATGQGDTFAVSGSMLPVTVAATVGGDSPSSLLQPGSSADVILRVTNDNAFAVRITDVTANGSISVSGASGSCAVPGVSFVDQTGLSVAVPASSTVLVHLPGAASMSSSSPSGCQGATFSIPVAVSSEQP